MRPRGHALTGVLAAACGLGAEYADIEDFESFEIGRSANANDCCPGCGEAAERTTQDLPAVGLRQTRWRCLADGPRCQDTVEQTPIALAPRVLVLPQGRCRSLAHGEGARRALATLEPRFCAWCGDQFHPTGFAARACSACQQQGRPRTCEDCGATYRAHTHRRGLCEGCRLKAHRTCVDCRQRFQLDPQQPRKVRCAACREAWQESKRQTREDCAAKRQRAAAELAAVRAEQGAPGDPLPVRCSPDDRPPAERVCLDCNRTFLQGKGFRARFCPDCRDAAFRRRRQGYAARRRRPPEQAKEDPMTQTPQEVA